MKHCPQLQTAKFALLILRLFNSPRQYSRGYKTVSTRLGYDPGAFTCSAALQYTCTGSYKAIHFLCSIITINKYFLLILLYPWSPTSQPQSYTSHLYCTVVLLYCTVEYQPEDFVRMACTPNRPYGTANGIKSVQNAPTVQYSAAPYSQTETSAD